MTNDAARARVHLVSLVPTPGRLADAWALISPEESARAARFRFARDRDAFVLAHGALRRHLARAVGTPPGALRLAARPDGKPFLPGTDLSFNLSHAHEVAAVAIARGVEVGVDVERVRTDLPILEMSEHFFSHAEAEWLAARPESARVRAFFAIWTRKEAYLKAIGKGLALPLDGFAVGTAAGMGPHAVVNVGGGPPLPLTLWALDAPPGYAAALVLLAAGAPAPRLFWPVAWGGEEDEDGERRIVPGHPPASDGSGAAESHERQA